jgi:carbamoyltransferase
MNILGIWDGHDAGAAIFQDNSIKVAINEERLSRRKVDIGFPVMSIKACLNYFKLKPTDINIVAACTSDPAKTLTRIFPLIRENYYKLKRRKVNKPKLLTLRRNLKYKFTEFKDNSVSRKLSYYFLNKELRKIGFRDFKLKIIDHHIAHAASAAFTSGFKKSLVITLDGVGDGLSGSVNIFNNGNIERISSIPAKDSLGILFEQVTTLLNMRELEDEGKVMALANYAYPIPDKDNKLLNFFKVDGLKIISRYSISRQFAILNKILWNNKAEDFAYMAQKTLEKNMYNLFNNAINETGLKDVCWSGGIASNIKSNMQAEKLCNNWHIFPHMGDGGLAVGSALQAANEEQGIKTKELSNAYLGQDYSNEYIKDVLNRYKSKIDFEEIDNIGKFAGDLIARNNIVFWFQGRMEYGPRALGNRSILASPFSDKIKEKLNMEIKQREWFQPFCPSLLEEEAEKLFSKVKQKDKFMVMGYQAKDEFKNKMKSVVHVDGSARPQMLGSENKKFRELLTEHKRLTGDGIVLNSSLNLHGFPIVNTPEQAIDLMLKTKSSHLCIGDFLCKLR